MTDLVENQVDFFWEIKSHGRVLGGLLVKKI